MLLFSDLIILFHAAFLDVQYFQLLHFFDAHPIDHLSIKHYGQLCQYRGNV